MSLKKLFGTNKSLENDGVTVDYGDFYLVIARAGGNNIAYKNELRRLSEKYRAKLRTNTLSNEAQESLMHEVYAKAILLDWGSKDHGKGKIALEEGEVLPYSSKNAVKVFGELPDFFDMVVSEASEMANFQEKQKQDAAKN